MDCMVPGPSWRCYSDVSYCDLCHEMGDKLCWCYAFRQVHSIIYPDWLWQKCKGAPCTLRRFANPAPVHFFWAKLALGNFVVENPVDAHQAHAFQILGMYISSCSPHNQWKDVWFVWKWEIPPVHLHFKRANDDLSLNGLWFSPQFTDTPSPHFRTVPNSQLEFPAHHHRPQVPPGICISWVFSAGVSHGVFQTFVDIHHPWLLDECISQVLATRRIPPLNQHFGHPTANRGIQQPPLPSKVSTVEASLAPRISPRPLFVGENDEYIGF